MNYQVRGEWDREREREMCVLFPPWGSEIMETVEDTEKKISPENSHFWMTMTDWGTVRASGKWFPKMLPTNSMMLPVLQSFRKEGSPGRTGIWCLCQLHRSVGLDFGQRFPCRRIHVGAEASCSDPPLISSRGTIILVNAKMVVHGQPRTALCILEFPNRRFF